MIEGNIGYLKIFQWTPYTEKNVRDAVESFAQKITRLSSSMYAEIQADCSPQS
jgi:hypothetical protein